MSQVFDATVERLGAYYKFPETVVEPVAEVAALQATMSCDEFLAYLNVPEPAMEPVDGAKPQTVLRITPDGDDWDPTRARVMGLAMGNGLTPNKNQIYQVATVFAADPTVQVLAFGNPGGIGNNEGCVSLKDVLQVARGNTRPLIDGSSKFLKKAGIVEVEYNTFSYGVLLGTTATEFASEYDQNVTLHTAIEPADVMNRGRKLIAMARLGVDFASTADALNGYVDANGLDAFVEARDDNIFGFVNYLLGILRPNNLARSSALANDEFEDRASRALRAQLESRLHVIWGSESELAKDALMWAISDGLLTEFHERYDFTWLEGQKHNMVNDLALQSALFLNARTIA